MRLWRLTRPEFAAALDGEGNRRHGARWNSPGRGVVYTSRNLSLCVLEAFVHLPPGMRARLPAMTAVEIEIPDASGVTVVPRADIAAMKAKGNVDTRCRAVGDAWLAAAAVLALEAPSFIVELETNVMLNPMHPRMAEVTIVRSEPFVFDSRLAWREG